MRALQIPALIACRKATAAAEMALVMPLLIILMFGAFELGNYFLSEHVVVKGVRDGARYASRQGFAHYDCSDLSVDDTIEAEVQEITRTGEVSDGDARLPGWTSNGTVTVSITCEDTVDAGDGSVVYSGIYEGLDEVPVVTVSASVPYNSLFNSIGFTSVGLLLKAESQSAVMGL